ncbi:MULTISPECIES: tetratricopeptide repeat protein [unclassified Janthinobacterium]|uniref:tetratricopeptide repeat protein n=1 Tax=unclassified Janthinobacterium TaxID=2610881 RepID=UPI0012EB7BCD|nr:MULTISPECIES: tetratricopeptide repeat protein [unclassified Janthinobacterium]MDN2711669.1 tetratricopeptide repeat protein [Janthinobacterium sp. SUN118]
MKKITLSFCLMMAFGAAYADELADAQKAWEAKDFSTAFQKFTKLANQGNSAAQLQLGEMYGFGEGTTEDAAQARHWLKQAAASGNPEAAASLELVQQRSARKADIAYYTTNFDGAAAAYGKFNCTQPVIPKVSTKNEEINSVNAAVNAWVDCYGRFVKNLNAAMPVTNTIPPDIIKLMNNEEFVRADALISKTYQGIASDGQTVADVIIADNIRWKKDTEEFVSNSNEQHKAQLLKLENDNDQESRNLRHLKDMKSIAYKKK